MKKARMAVTVMHRHRPQQWALGLVVAAACVLATALPVQAQRPVTVVGAVQWISSTSMAVMTEAGQSVTIELISADQSTYRALRSGDWVLIDGTVAPDRRRVIARGIWREDSRGAWTQAP
jgi:hypothetical protein